MLFESKKKDSVVKVIDWGTATAYKDDEKLTEKNGTPYYIAPEVHKHSYDEKCDVWSCGIIMYIILCGYPPFRGKTKEEIKGRIMAGNA